MTVVGPNSVTKKSGSRGNPLSKADRITSDRYENIQKLDDRNIAICAAGARVGGGAETASAALANRVQGGCMDGALTRD